MRPSQRCERCWPVAASPAPGVAVPRTTLS